MTNIFIIARKIHRILVLIIITLGILMMLTGVAMRYPVFMSELFPGLDLSLMRFLHNKFSTYFGIMLGLMMLTGLYMYLHTWLVRRRQQKTSSSQDG